MKTKTLRHQAVFFPEVPYPQFTPGDRFVFTAKTRQRAENLARMSARDNKGTIVIFELKEGKWTAVDKYETPAGPVLTI